MRRAKAANGDLFGDAEGGVRGDGAQARDEAGVVDPAHDPGVQASRRRAETLAEGLGATPIVIQGGGSVRVGSASWTDRTMTAPGVFYDDDATSAEDRLRFYASRFSTVEIDSPYYALPARRSAEQWAARTPPGFVFDVKAHALMTGHPSEISRLPRELREALPPALAAKKRVYANELPSEVHDEVWRIFRDAMEPLEEAGKLGAVLLQYPKWVGPSRANREMILQARERLGGLTMAVEFRNGRWFEQNDLDRTLRFLSDNALPFVMVDGPQGLASSVPPVVAVTSPALAIVRLHGRRVDQWERRGALVVDKYRYLYDSDELEAWVPKVLEAAQAAREARVIFNNCYGNYATTNAKEMAGLLMRGAPTR